jgi:hypothetical protein
LGVDQKTTSVALAGGWWELAKRQAVRGARCRGLKEHPPKEEIGNEKDNSLAASAREAERSRRQGSSGKSSFSPKMSSSSDQNRLAV